MKLTDKKTKESLRGCCFEDSTDCLQILYELLQEVNVSYKDPKNPTLILADGRIAKVGDYVLVYPNKRVKISDYETMLQDYEIVNL